MMFGNNNVNDNAKPVTGKDKNYKVVSVLSKDGCDTKFNSSGRYSSDKSGTPLPAAKKAFSELCRVKNIRGQCTFFVTVEESYRGSNKKQFSYMMKRMKRPEPVLLGSGKDARVIEYQVEGKSMSPEEIKKACSKKQTRGPMKKKTAKKRPANQKNKSARKTRSL